jgi:hypothetical protein
MQQVLILCISELHPALLIFQISRVILPRRSGFQHMVLILSTLFHFPGFTTHSYLYYRTNALFFIKIPSRSDSGGRSLPFNG